MIRVNDVELESGSVHLSISLTLEDINDMLNSHHETAIECLGGCMLNLLEDNSDVQSIVKNTPT